jgi:hypothetical protein
MRWEDHTPDEWLKLAFIALITVAVAGALITWAALKW